MRRLQRTNPSYVGAVFTGNTRLRKKNSHWKDKSEDVIKKLRHEISTLKEQVDDFKNEINRDEKLEV